MLRKDCLPKETLVVLETISKEPYFADFFLVGGTALTLHFGHRLSVDLDFFTLNSIQHLELLDEVKSHFKKVEKTGEIKPALFVNLDNVKVDFVSYKYPMLEPVKKIEGITIASVRDIAAMKVAAITNRGTRKDFCDMYYLLDVYSANEIIGFYEQKFGTESTFFALKSLLYFEDADKSDMPLMLSKNITWKDIKNKIAKMFIKL